MALGVFLDIEGAFNYTTFDCVSEAASGFGVKDTIVRRIRAMLAGRLITASVGDDTRCASVTRGCPQGSVLSSLLWCLVADGLLSTLNKNGVYAQAYADDLAIVITGKFPGTVRDLMQKCLKKVER